MILLIDNYDSFSYNLFQLVGSFDPDIRVCRNNEISLEEIKQLSPDAIILSPGPGRPSGAGICIEAVKTFGGRIKILGVCLGHQAICEAYGAKVSYARQIMHGKTSVITVDNTSPIFHNMDNKITAGRYHSLAAVRETIPETLKITAETQDGEVMAVQHREYPVFGLQFHPESILTPRGVEIIKNFLEAEHHD
ncbi:MAG: anthranilate synthase component II [Christensenellales bacterium]